MVNQEQATQTKSRAWIGSLPGLSVPWITLLGVDGSGKSSVLRRLAERQKELPFKGIRVFHRRPRLVYSSSSSPGSQVTHYSKPNHNRWMSMLKIVAMTLDWNLGFWRSIYSPAREGYLVVADRHSLLDMLVDPERYRYGGPPGFVRLALRLSPRPSLILLLDAPGEILLARKQELSQEKLTRLRSGYLEAFRNCSNCCLIDASRPLEEVVSEIVQVLRNRFDDP